MLTELHSIGIGIYVELVGVAVWGGFHWYFLLFVKFPWGCDNYYVALGNDICIRN
jgi:hypothetical protein